MSAATAAMDSVGEWSTNGKGCGWEAECSSTYPVRGICPEGWHLPANSEWNALFTAVGGRSAADMMLKSTSGWFDSGNGTDAYSFAVLPAGYYWGNVLDYLYEGSFTRIWSSTGYRNTGSAYYMRVNGGDDASLYYGENFKFSVRCVKDE